MSALNGVVREEGDSPSSQLEVLVIRFNFNRTFQRIRISCGFLLTDRNEGEEEMLVHVGIVNNSRVTFRSAFMVVFVSALLSCIIPEGYFAGHP